jgi:hypothetical protein
MVKPFMGIDTMIEERLLQCCVHVGTVAGDHHQCVPFCAAQAWEQLAATKIGAPHRSSTLLSNEDAGGLTL